VTTPRHRGSVSDAHPPLDPPIGNVVITVTDSGPGLSLEQQQALFHQGVQFNPNQLQAGQGSGLGLWISKEIVCLHHGTIIATSAGLGRGSSFQVTLPLILREEVSLSARLVPPPSSPHTLDVSEGDGGGETRIAIPAPEPRARHVLVVDDAPSNRKLVSRLMKSKGFTCHEAENGAECVEMVLSGEHPYELILMDYEMPVMDGPSAARRLRDHRCELLIIGVTGNVLPEDKAHFLACGANAVLAKPLVVSELFEVILNHQSSPLVRV
jgi:two-component system, sensor histidine kinase